MPDGYCTLDDVRRALREKDLPGDIAQDTDIAIDAIAGLTERLEKQTGYHWYVSGGVTGDTENLVPTAANTRDDEHDIPRHGGLVHGASEHERYRYRENSDALLEAGPRYERRRKFYRHPKQEIRIALGDATVLEPPVDETVPAYTRITLERRHVQTINTLNVVNADGGYDDWVSSSDYDGGVGNANRGKDYWVRVNNGGVSELYLDVHAMDDDLVSLSNAVYVDLDYGHEGLPRSVRRGVACLAAAELVEDAVIEIPQNATVYNIETKAEDLRATAADRLSEYGYEPAREA